MFQEGGWVGSRHVIEGCEFVSHDGIKIMQWPYVVLLRSV
jgi:hypothetical protein